MKMHNCLLIMYQHFVKLRYVWLEIALARLCSGWQRNLAALPPPAANWGVTVRFRCTGLTSGCPPRSDGNRSICRNGGIPKVRPAAADPNNGNLRTGQCVPCRRWSPRTPPLEAVSVGNVQTLGRKIFFRLLEPLQDLQTFFVCQCFEYV